MKEINRHIQGNWTVVAVVALVCIALSYLFPQPAYGVTSEELFAEAESIMQQVDALQTDINKEIEIYNTALEEHESANKEAQAAGQRVKQEQARIELNRKRLSALVVDMYKTNDSSSFLEVMLGSTSFDEFLTNWDSLSLVSDQGAEFVQDAKIAKAAEEAARAEFEEKSALAEKTMQKAEDSRKTIEKKQQELKEEAEKISEEALELQAQEELEREAARQAAIAAEEAERARQAAESATLTTGGSVNMSLSGSGLLGHPLPGASISSGFGYRSLDGGTFHKGLDLAAPEGTPYYAAESGTVMYATYDGGYNGGAGNWIVIAHGNGIVTKYMHSSAVYVSVGEHVEKGQTIGAVGNTGHSYGAHLHFQVEYNGVAVDPTAFL